MNEECFVGVDVSKAWLDVAQVRGEQVEAPRRVANDEAGRGRLCEAMVQLKPTLIVMEASGGGQPQKGARLRQSGRGAGQDRSAGCRCVGAYCSAHAAA